MSSSAASDKVRASHMLIKHQGSRRKASWKDSEGRVISNTTRETVVSQLKSLREDIVSGKVKFKDVASRYSDCSSAKRGDDLGLMLAPFLICFHHLCDPKHYNEACNHAGFLEKGWEYFDLMTKVYKLNPEVDHYSCMADLLGRRGKLKEALEFIHNMPVKPDEGIWGALLGACKIHHNIEIGQYAADRLFEIEPQAAAPYVEIANIYASAGRWNGVSAIRTRMKCKQVTKSGACFFTQGVVHRDVKPGNFLFSRKVNKGYLIDFNLAMDLHHKYVTSAEETFERWSLFSRATQSKKEESDIVNHQI